MKTYVLSVLILIFPHIAIAQTSNHIKITEDKHPVAEDDYKENLDTQCRAICGEGYVYDRPGAKRNGKEKVCTKYPADCGYSCTTGWNFRYLAGGTDFTCQEAVIGKTNPK